MIHLVGIGGIGMSAIARLLLARGVPVSGSDLSRTPLIELLEAEGARIAIGHASANVEDADRLVYSSAVAEGNPELLRARERGIPIVSRGEMLADLTRGKSTIAIAGTHGKTTTTAMVATILEAAGLDPTVALGGERLDTLANARSGEGRWFVTESDESDGSFLWLDPTVAIVTNIENDHVANDDEWNAMLATFERFVAKVPADGTLVVGVDDERCAQLAARDIGAPMITFGIHAPAATLRARIVGSEGFGTVSEVEVHGKTLGRLELRVPGEINLQNALAALGAARALGIPFEIAAAALATFRGVRRRFEILARTPQLTIVDDYAHHPTAVRATIAAARIYHRGPLVVAFEPHRYTRTQYLSADFAEALSGADRVVLAPVYAASEAPIPGVSERSIGEPLASRGVEVSYVAATGDLPAHIRAHAQQGSLVLMLGAGSISRVAHAFAAQLEVPIS